MVEKSDSTLQYVIVDVPSCYLLSLGLLVPLIDIPFVCNGCNCTQVQSGGSFDIDYMVTDPTHNIVVSGEKERQGDFVFSAEHVGEYSFCFSNGKIFDYL